jgi:hypothetical protein
MRGQSFKSQNAFNRQNARRRNPFGFRPLRGPVRGAGSLVAHPAPRSRLGQLEAIRPLALAQ